MDTNKQRSARIQIREKLQEVVPLDTPYQLVVDITNRCNFHCAFCPTGDKALIRSINRPSGMMPFELFCRIIDGIKEFESKVRRIDLGKDGEQLLHKRIVDMIRYVKQADVTDLVSIATNASLLTRETADELVDAGLDLLKISVEAVSSQGYKEICGVDFDYDDLVARVAYIFSRRKQCRLYAKIIDYGLTQHQKDKFYRDFDSISDYITVDFVSGWSVTQAKDFTLGSRPDRYLDLPGFNKKEVCPFPFYTLSVNFDGSVSICCVDWTLSTIVGDLTKQSIKEVWNGERLYNFRKMHLTRNRRLNKACADCSTRDGLPDNIDAHAEAILARLATTRAREPDR